MASFPMHSSALCQTAGKHCQGESVSQLVPQLIVNYSVAVSSNQTVMLKLYDSAIHRHQSKINLNVADEKLLIMTLRDTCIQAVEALRKLPNVSSSALGSGDGSEDQVMTGSGTSGDGDDDQSNVRMAVEDSANAYTGVILLLQTIGTMIVEERCSEKAKRTLVNSGCLKSCLGKLKHIQYSREFEGEKKKKCNPALTNIDLLAQAERKIPRITRSMGTTMVSDTDTSKGTVGFMYIKRDIVRLIGALTYQDRQMQDEVRKKISRIWKMLIHSFCTTKDRFELTTRPI